MKCKYPESVCGNMTMLHGIAYCDSVPCSLRGELPLMTNADRIRAMSDKELAEFIPNWSYTKACKCDEETFVGCNNECEKCVIEWLQQPIEED